MQTVKVHSIKLCFLLNNLPQVLHITKYNKITEVLTTIRNFQEKLNKFVA